MRCPYFVGRSEELAALQRAADGARGGQGSWVTLVGEAGIGKSRLAAEAAARVARAGGRALFGRCSAVDRATPYRPLAEALMDGAGDVERPHGDAALRPYLPAVERFLPHWRRAASALVSESPAVVGESIVRVISWLAAQTTAGFVVLVLEDLHWADGETVTLCEYIVDHLGRAPILVIATAREGEMPAATRAMLRRRAVVPLKAMSPDEVLQVAAGCLGGDAPPDVVQRLQARAEGLPLLVEDLLGEGGSSRFDDLVRSRFEALSPPSQRLVVAAALSGERFDWRRLAAAVARDGADAAAAWDEVTAAQLVVPEGDGFRFRHALTRDAVLTSAPGLALALAPAVAQALESTSDDDDLALVAELWAKAGEPGRATGLLDRAAAAAARRGAPGAAMALLRRAAALAPDPGVRAGIDLTRLDLLVAHGHVDDALALGGTLLDTSADPSRVHRSLARASLAAGRASEAAPHVEALGYGAEQLTLRSHVALATAGAERRVAAEHLGRQAVAQAEREGRFDLACEALEIVARCARTRSLADAQAALERALAIAEQGKFAAGRLRILNELGTVEMLRAADGSRLLRAYEQAREAGALDVAVGIEVNIAALHAMRGDLDETAAAAERAEAAARRLGIQPLVAAALVMRALSDGFRGRRDPMERRLREARRLSPHDTDLESFAWGAGRGLCALVREERADALAAFRHAVQPDPPVGSLDTALGPLLLTLAASGQATQDDLDAARSTSTPGAGWSDFWLGYGEAALEGSRAAFDAADVAARRHPLFRAIGLRLVAESALRDGWDDPVGWLRDAEAVFVAGGQDRIASACRALLKQAGAPVTRLRGVDRGLPADLLRFGITAREAEVLELVGERLGNKEIATRLFLSPRTVEKHVASLLAKLDAADRAALIAIARRR